MLFWGVVFCMIFSACTKLASGNVKGKDKPITVGIVSGAVANKVFNAAKDVLETKGYKIELKVFNDYISPNSGTADGSIDYNFYQHRAFLNEFNKSNNTELVQVGDGIYTLNYGLFSKKIKSIDEIEDGMTISIQNDTSNRRTSLIMLEEAGIIKLKEGVDMPTLLDIEDNIKNINFIEMEETMIVNSLEDVDLGCVSTNSVKTAGGDPTTAITTISMEETNLILVTNKSNENTEISKAIYDALTSVEVKKYLEENYAGISDQNFKK